MPKLWFKNKSYGYGWYPATWQGWLVLFVYLVLVTLFALTLDNDSSGKEIVFTFALPVILLTITLIRIAYKTGESPRWQWGNKMQPATIILGKKILVLTAHPDDESFLAAGTIYANSKANGQTFLVCATLGEKGASHLQEKLDEVQLQDVRHKELHKAADELGITYTKTMRYPDGKVHEHETELLAEVSAHWSEINPEVIISFGSDGITRHKDHLAVSRVASELAKKYKLPLATFCIPHQVVSEAHEWLKQRRKTKGHYDDHCAALQKENLVIPINGDIKLKVLKCYESQLDADLPFHGFPDHIAEALLKQESFYVQKPK